MAIKIKRKKKVRKKIRNFLFFVRKVFKFFKSLVVNYFLIISWLVDLAEFLTFRILFPLLKFILFDMLLYSLYQVNEVFNGNKYLTFFALLIYFFVVFFVISNIGFVAAFMLVL